MDLNILKESNIEYCENMYALTMNYLRNRDNEELRGLIKAMDKLESLIKECDEIVQLNKYIDDLSVLFHRIEVIVNE